MYLFGYVIGFNSFIKGHYKIGIKRMIHPVGYWRYPVFNYIIKKLINKEKLRVLDIGSPKILSLYFALRKGYETFSIDIQDLEIYSVWKTYYLDSKNSNIFKIDKYKNQHLFIPEIQDGRKLDYPDNFFDLVYSVSVLEHIPSDGDSLTMKEIERVLKPNGTAIIEVPYSAKEYDTYMDGDVYDRKYSNQPVFYQRHYDNRTINTRIIFPSRMVLDSGLIITERISLEAMMSNIPKILQIPLLMLTPIISKLNHKLKPIKTICPIDNKKQVANDIILVLNKKG
jgi:SAM-dependent methyltransferase